jgi:hypothetical protein
MSDEVGVDVERIGQLASALENLRDVLAANVPTIVNTMNSYWSGGTGSPISLQPLQQAQSRSVNDATDIRDRATMALAYQNQANVCFAPGSKVNIPWDSSQQQLDADSAKAAAQNLAAAEALAKTNPTLARAQIAAIQAQMQDNLDSKDTAWVQNFYNNGGAAAAANLAQTLHDLETPGNKNADYANRFQVLTSADQKTVATFGNGLALADKAGLSPQAVQSLVNSPNMWSTTMLVKYGPPGSSWAKNEPGNQPNSAQPSLLAQLTLATYQDLQNGKITVPVGFGLQYGAHYDQQDMDKLYSTLNSNDPFQVLMQADAQNKNASWQVLGNKQYGSAIANMLLNSQKGDLPQLDGRYAQQMGSDGQSTGTFALIPPGKSVPQQDDFGATFINTPDQKVVGAFLDAATSDSPPRGSDLNAQESAQAAMNVIRATLPPILGKGTVQEGYDPAITKALTDTFTRYMPDIAVSDHLNGNGAYLGLHTNAAGQVDGGYNFQLPRGDLTAFLQEISSTPTNYATVKAAVASAAGTALAFQLKGITADGTSPFDDLTYLYGSLAAQNNNLHYSAAQIKDTYNTQLNAEIAFGEQFIKDIPVVGSAADTALSYDQQLSALGVPQVPQFSTDNAQQSATAGQATMNQDELMAMVPIVQGLAQGNVNIYTHETGSQSVQAIGKSEGWYVDGKVVPNAQFWHWMGSSGGAYVKNLSSQGPNYTQSTINQEYQEWLSWMKLGYGVNNQTGPS